MISAAEYIFKFLAARGFDKAFMLSGGGCMYLCNALGKSAIDYTCCLHEQAVTIAALGYAQYSGKIGLSLVTSGPGAANAITGVLAAWTESVPMLVLSGQVKTEDSARKHGVRVRGVQEAPIIDMVKPITKYAALVDNPADIKYQLDKALVTAVCGRPGPVWLDIPLNVQSAMIDEDGIIASPLPSEERQNTGVYAKEIIEMIRGAKRPVILGGYGIRIADSIESFLQLVSALGIPVLTTWKAADIIADDHPLFMGRPGIAGQRAANFIQQNADLLICMGARLDFPQTGFNQMLFAREAQKIIIDVDGAELKKFPFTIDYPVCADIGAVLREMNKLVSGGFAQMPERQGWLEQCVTWRSRYPLVLPEHYQKKDYTSLYVLIETLSALLTEDDVIVPGSSGMGSDVSYQVTRIKEGQRMLNSPGLGSMGFGIPSAIGACIACGKKRTICVNGDGGFQMNIQELETVKSLRLPIKFFVLNNKGYASIRNTQRTYFNGFYAGSSEDSGVSLPDIKKIAAAYGFPVFSITNNREINEGISRTLEVEGPALCEVIMDPNDTLSLKASSYIQRDGTAVSAPVEDLYPFLPRKEFYQNMYIKPLNKTGINLCSIIFDLDGTLIDSKKGIIASMKYALGESGIASPGDERIAKTIGLPLPSMIAELTGGVDAETQARIIACYRTHYAEEGVYNSELYPGIENMLITLSKEFDLYIATTKLRAMAQKALIHHKLDRYFLEVKGIESDTSAEKKARMIQELIDKKKIDAHKSIMVGDRNEDIMVAAGNNIKTVAVSYGYASVPELQDALYIAGSAEELTSILAG